MLYDELECTFRPCRFGDSQPCDIDILIITRFLMRHTAAHCFQASRVHTSARSTFANPLPIFNGQRIHSVRHYKAHADSLSFSLRHLTFSFFVKTNL